ncbi:MAG TPA: hypothetical protein VL053_15765, partial [Arachidicoccus sp.]|nr:hypothetical protein [Arachidicoccus sp.]
MKRRFIWIVFFILILISGSIAFWLWNRPPERIEAIQGATISVDSLCAAFNLDESAANKEFLNKAINITGKVNEIIHNLDGGLMVVIVDITLTAEVQCAF